MIVSTARKCRGMGSAGSSIGVAAGGAIASAAAFTGPAAPIVAAVGGIVAAASAIAGALHIGEGCGQTCVQATSIVNQAEPVFKQNLDGYLAGSIDRTTALSNFNQVWTAVQQSCAQIPGDAGTNCVSDRAEGSCKWKSNGECWNWFVGYRDPINTTNVSTSTGSSASDLVSSLTGNSLYLGLGILAIGYVLSRK